MAVGISLLGHTVFPQGRMAAVTYPMPARLGLAVVLAALPSALIAELVGRARVARLLATAGMVGTVAAALLHVLIYTSREHVNASHLLSVAALLSAPAVLLWLGRRDAGHRRANAGRCAVLSLSLAALFSAAVAAGAILELINDDPFPSRYRATGPDSLSDPSLAGGGGGGGSRDAVTRGFSC